MSGKENEIVIPPRYETLGRARPRGNHSPHSFPSQNFSNNQGINPFQRVPQVPQVPQIPQNPQIRQNYQQPLVQNLPSHRVSSMPISSIPNSGVPYNNFATVGRQPSQPNPYRQASPSLNPINRQPLRTPRGSSQQSNNQPGYYPVIPTRDISRHPQNSNSTLYRHNPSSSVSVKSNVSDISPHFSRSNTLTSDSSYRSHPTVNSFSTLFSDESSKISDEPIIPLRGKSSTSTINRVNSNSPKGSSEINFSRNFESSPVHHHIRSQSYSNLIPNTGKINGKTRSNSTANNSPTNITNNSLLNSRQTKSEDNVASKIKQVTSPSILTSNVLNDPDEYESPVESSPSHIHINPGQFTASPNLSGDDSFVSQDSPVMVPSSPGRDNSSRSRNDYRTQSIYSNFSVMTTSGEVMEFKGIQSLDAIEEMLKNDAFNSKSVNNMDINGIPQLITQPIIEEPKPIVIPTRTNASFHPKSTTPLASTDNILDELTKTSSVKSQNNNSNNGSSETINEDEETGFIEHSALLSEIAEEFLNSIPLVKRVKDSIEYTDCFTGADAVDTIASLIDTKNRKLALALGRSLESQYFFHDVLYTNNLIDSKDNIYQLHVHSSMRFNRDSRIDFAAFIDNYIEEDQNKDIYSNEDSSHNKAGHNHTNAQYELPSGVFLAIASCYSPTCTDDSPCYSYSCPRRKAFNLKSSSKDSKQNLYNIIENSNDNAWSTTVDKNVLEKVDDHERKRQEVIYEFIQSEKEYVEDLINVTKLIKRPLSEGVVPKIENGFVNVVFSNIEEILSCNAPFSQALQAMQKKNSIIDRLGDITLEFVKTFTCYIRYGEIQPLAKEVLQYHRNINSNLESYLKEMQSRKEFRRLPLESFLARPTTRLGRYPILIKDILKHTKEDHPDQKTLKVTMEIIQNILKQVNEKAGKTTNKIKLDQWAKSLDQTTMEKIEDILTLRLNSPQREFLREGTLLLKRDGAAPQEVDIVFLDNAFIITRKKVNTIEIIKKPIPVQLIKLEDHEEQDNVNNKNLAFNEKRYSFSIAHMGYRNYTLMTKVYSEKKSWVETIEERLKQVQGSRIEMFNIFSCHLKINSAVVVKDDIMIFANENGLYTNCGNTLTMILPLQRITNIDIMPDAGLLFVLIDKEVIPYSIDSLLKGNLVSNFKKPRKLCSGISFMKIGFCDGHHLLCAVKTANTNSTVRSYEPNQALINAINTGNCKKAVSTIDVLIPHKQFYIPAEAKSIQFLKRALCVGCTKGFEVVDINTLTTQSLFDTHNPEYEWIIKAEYNPIKLIKTIKGDFIVCYNKVGFFLDKNGNPSRGNTRFFWLNPATSFAYISPYILAISESYIEVWDERDPDSVKQIIYGYNIRLFTSYTGDAVYIISGNDMHLISRIILSRKRVL